MNDEQRLAALRTKYGNAQAGDVYDPEFKKVVSLLFDGNDKRAKPYSGVSTFLDAAYAPDAVTQPKLGGLDVALVGVPMDLGVTHRPGARFGPRAVRAVERVGPYHHFHKIVASKALQVADVGDVPFQSRYSLEQSHIDIEQYWQHFARENVSTIAVGGDHSITLPIQKALGKKQPLAMIHFDAHCDTGGPFEGSKFHHGGPFREAVLAGVLDPTRTIQIGIRGNAEYLWEFSYESGMTVLHIEDVDRLGVDGVIAAARSVVGDGPVYISFDVDGLDPAFAPGTGTPEHGGLNPREVHGILRGLAGINVVAGDVVEVAPQYDPTTVTAQAGAQMCFEILTLIALARRAHGKPQFT